MPIAKLDPIRLDFQSRQQVVVIPDDEDRFVTTVREAARACQQAEASKEWQEQWSSFLSYIRDWCVERESKVSSAYVDVGDGGLRVNVCTNSADYDFDFDDQVTELDIVLAHDFPMCMAEVTQIPDQASLRRELSSETMVQVYGDS